MAGAGNNAPLRRPVIDDSAKCFDIESQARLAEYISRPPVSLEKLRYDPMHSRIPWHTKHSRYFDQNVKMMCRDSPKAISQPEAFHKVKNVGDGAELIRELVQHIPASAYRPKIIQLIRRYALGGPDLLLARKGHMDR